GVHGAPRTLDADLLHTSLQPSLHFLVLAGDPTDEGPHRFRQVSFPPGTLALAQCTRLHISRPHIHDEKTRANTLRGALVLLSPGSARAAASARAAGRLRPSGFAPDGCPRRGTTARLCSAAAHRLPFRSVQSHPPPGAHLWHKT